MTKKNFLRMKHTFFIGLHLFKIKKFSSKYCFKKFNKSGIKKAVKKVVFRLHDIALIWWIFEKFK